MSHKRHCNVHRRLTHTQTQAEGESAEHLLCIAYCTVKQNNSNNKTTWKLLYCRRWHPYTMHLRHLIGPGLFHFHSSAKYLSFFLLSLSHSLTLSSTISMCCSLHFLYTTNFSLCSNTVSQDISSKFSARLCTE